MQLRGRGSAVAQGESSRFGANLKNGISRWKIEDADGKRW